MSAAPDIGGGRRLAYLVYSYPAISQAFVLREVQELRRLGFEIVPCSLHRPDPAHLLADADRREAERTFSLLPPDRPALLRAHLAVLARHPGAYLRTLAAAVRDGGTDPRAVAISVACFAFAVLLWRRLSREGVRHVHTHFAGMPTHIAWLTTVLGNAIGGGTPWTWSLTVHGSAEFYDVSAYKLERRLRQAAFVACVSEFTRNQLMLLLRRDEWPKLRLVRCGIDREVFARPPAPRQATNGRVELLTVGRLVNFKAHPILIRAVAELVRRGHDPHLTIVGDGPLADDARAEVEAHGVADRVTFAGAVGQDDIRRFYAQTDVFCLSSLAEALPVVLMEAMAMEVPVVATRVGGVAELVDDGRSGRLVPAGRADRLADALEPLLADPDLRARMGHEGREKVLSEFDLRRWTRELAALFASLPGEAPR